MSKGHLDQEAMDAAKAAVARCPPGHRTIGTAIHFDEAGKRDFRFAYVREKASRARAKEASPGPAPAKRGALAAEKPPQGSLL